MQQNINIVDAFFHFLFFKFFAQSTLHGNFQYIDIMILWKHFHVISTAYTISIWCDTHTKFPKLNALSARHFLLHRSKNCETHYSKIKID